MPDLKALGSGATRYSFTEPDASLLERFPSPATEGQCLTLHIEAPEFTSLCPITGQPDFATMVIDYTPGAWCVESKALKLYLMGYRMHGAFHEACVSQIARDLWALLGDARYLRVEGQFTPRGGIPFWPTVEMSAPCSPA
jgi:7-cyano-7-deazaguanine reductase